MKNPSKKVSTFNKFVLDIKATYLNDPACKGLQIILYPSIHALLFHRFLSHPLYKIKFFFLARLLSQIARLYTHIEIHPGAEIEGGLFIDHGSGVVIGETASIGVNCILFHGVSLGGTGKQCGLRHPSIGNNVYIGTNATLLGPIQVGNFSKIGACSVVINRDIPDHSTVVGAPGKIVKQYNKRIKEPIDLPLSNYRQKEKKTEENL